jgi:AraC-like DNA-binding protein
MEQLSFVAFVLGVIATRIGFARTSATRPARQRLAGCSPCARRQPAFATGGVPARS